MTPLRCALVRLGACRGPFDEHHVLSKQRIKRSGQWDDLERVLRDERNLVCVCRHHHDLLEWKRVYLERFDLPDGFEDFAREVELTWAIPHVLGPR